MGSEMCIRDRSGTRWVEPMLGASQLVPVHPDAVGEAAMARITAETLGL